MPPERNSRPVQRRRLAPVLALALALAWPPAGQAERADRDKPVNIEADRMNADDARKTATFDGHVILTQGTMTIRAERIVVRQDSEGFQFGTATAAPGALASFRQKREGYDEYIDAQAERIEYDGRADRIEFFNRARLRRGAGDDVCGNYISYDSRTEFFAVNSGRPAGGAAGTAGTGNNRVHAVLMPRNGAPADSRTPAPKPAPCPN